MIHLFSSRFPGANRHIMRTMSRMLSRLLARFVLTPLLVGWCGGAAFAADRPADFLRDVRPILATHCFKCHGPDEGARKSGLRLDLREQALRGGKSKKPAIVPDKPNESELIRRINTSDPDDLMPPPAAKLPLTDAQREILTQWISKGAEYKPHWAFAAPRQAPLPTVRHGSWPRNEIDYFVLARLEKEGLSPSTEADKYTLVRRVYLDLIGLPPTPAQVEAFVKNSSPNAYENLVDDLLASPHYGERWARRWLDLARYADTNGYEKDRQRSMWPYRDWLIKALNSDMPFDEFTIEQIAGDMLPNATRDQVVATGFNRNTMLNEEGGIDPLEYRFYSMVDRVHVTATTWLGLTMACAQCHTHKFDPIQHTEYYQFMAFLDNADEPMIELPKRDLVEKRNRIEAKIAKLEANLADRFPAESMIEWLTPASGDFTSAGGAEGTRLEDGSFRVTGKKPDKDTYTLQFESAPARITHVELEAIPDDKLGGPGRTDHGNFVLSEIEMEVVRGGETKKLKFSGAEADYSQNGFGPEQAIDGKREKGWSIDNGDKTRTHRRAIFTLTEPLKLESGSVVTVRLVQDYGSKHTLERFRLSFGNDLSNPATLDERRMQAREKRFARWLKAEKAKLAKWEPLRPIEAKSGAPVLTIESDGSVFASGDFTKQDIYRLNFKGVPAGVRALRIEALPDDRLPAHGPGTVHYEGPDGDFFLSTLTVTNGGKQIVLTNATESFASGDNNAVKAIDDDQQSGWSISGGQGKAHNAVFQFATSATSDELEVTMTFERYYASALGKFRVWVTTDENAVASGLANDAYTALQKYKKEAQPQLAAEDRALLLRDFAEVTPELASVRKEIADLRASMPKLPTTLVMRERTHPRTTYRHHRGEFLQAKEEVQPGVPAFLPQLPPGAPKNRLSFARWLVSPENPLTARVTVNRNWEAFFGRGIVRTLEDFGFQGELPTHPELLDWLAVEFMKEGWSVKKLQKTIVMSATYRQSSNVTPELHERDPLNLLLARGPRVRLEAELVRDSALAAAGLLSEKMGGPSVFPPQPPGVSTEGAYGPLAWKVSDGPDRYRRGLYTFMKRTAPYAMTLTFDGPSGEACLARRDRSNTPLQALTVLNDEVFVQCARSLGQWAARQKAAVPATVQQLFRRCVSRPATAEEQKKLCDFYSAQLERFKNGDLKPEDFLGTDKADSPEEQAAWAALARVLLNLDETIMKS
jgi:hypothetical protein